MNIRVTIAAIVIATGCTFPRTDRISPPCEWREEAERLGHAYAIRFGVEPDWDCLHDFDVLVEHDLVDRWCDAGAGAVAVACYLHGGTKRKDRTIVVDRAWWDDATERDRVGLMRHELTHHILRCETGDIDDRHVGEGFGFAGTGDIWAGVGSLAQVADEVDAEDVGVWCEHGDET